MTSAPSNHERERLLALIVEYLLDKGVLDLRLRALGEAIGSSHRVLLYYFGSREQLIAEALDEAARRSNVRATTLLGPTGTGPVQPELVRVWKLVSGAEQLPLIRLFLQVVALALHDRDRYAGFLGALETEWSSAYEGYLTGHGVPGDEAVELSREIIGLQRGLQLELAVGGPSELLDRSFAAAAGRWARRVEEFAG